MATHRDIVRANRGILYRKGITLGITMDSERQQPKADQRTLSFQALKLINDQTPRTTREALVVDNPPDGAFNGVNTTFTLSRAVAGLNIAVIWGDNASPKTLLLVRSTESPPAAGEFFFDPTTPTQIVVGNPPLAGDALIAVYKVDQ